MNPNDAMINFKTTLWLNSVFGCMTCKVLICSSSKFGLFSLRISELTL